MARLLWTPARSAELERLLAEGLSDREIGRRLGTSANAIGIRRRACKLSSRRDASFWTRARTAELERLLDEGLTDKQIGKRLGTTGNAVSSRRRVCNLAASSKSAIVLTAGDFEADDPAAPDTEAALDELAIGIGRMLARQHHAALAGQAERRRPARAIPVAEVELDDELEAGGVVGGDRMAQATEPRRAPLAADPESGSPHRQSEIAAFVVERLASEGELAAAAAVPPGDTARA